jgi:hypothetical protein
MYVFIEICKFTVSLLVHRNNITQSSKLEQPPLITLPPPPPLYNAERHRPLVNYSVLAFPVPINFLMEWANNHDIPPSEWTLRRRELALDAIFKKLPLDCRKKEYVPTEFGQFTTSIVVATNLTPEDLKKGEDVKLIQTFQRVLNTDTLPKWFVPEAM